MTAQIVEAAPSFIRLAPDSPLRRTLVSPHVSAPESFLARFDALTLVYDCFWHADGSRVLMVGPPPLNLMRDWQAARFTALPSGTSLAATWSVSLSQMVTVLSDVPPGTSAVSVGFGGQTFEVGVGANLSTQFAGRRVLFSMNKDNTLSWIRQWAAHHVATQGTDAVVLFDNASSLYTVPQIIDTLRAVEGLDVIAVPSWPWPFGARDPRTELNPFWSHFLQNCAMNVVLRRMGAAAHSLLNVDVDELVWAGEGRSVHELVKHSRTGFVTFKGQWVEAIARDGAPDDHRAFTARLSDVSARTSPAYKWALDPSRRWTQSLKIHPYWHWLHNRPWFSKERRRDISYWHFKGINTNWKLQRAVTTPFDAARHEQDMDLVRLFGVGSTGRTAT